MKKRLLFCFSLLFLTACTTIKNEMIYAISANSEIAIVSFNPKTADLKLVRKEAIRERSGAICYSPKHQLIYAAGGRSGKGQIYSLNKNGTSYKKRDFDFANGYCYLTLDRTGKFLLAASYRTGDIDIYKLSDDGTPLLVETRQDRPKEAHAIITTYDNKYLYVPFVKENNSLFQYAFDERTGKIKPLNPAQAEVAQIAGPRHPALHPNKSFIYFSNEQQMGISVYQISQDGTLKLMQICPPLDVQKAEHMSGSAVSIGKSGKYLYSAIRNPNGNNNYIITYEVLSDGKVKAIHKMQTDEIPWIIKLNNTGEFLLVSASKGETLTAFRILENGALKEVSKIKWGSFRDMTIAY